QILVSRIITAFSQYKQVHSISSFVFFKTDTAFFYFNARRVEPKTPTAVIFGNFTHINNNIL
ncbi:MAG: hypothetical protein IJC20_01465, partial [Clostridia bacterium]|nr:hypothetical protein [Clostridia bacterium]